MHIVYIGLSYYPPQIGKVDIMKISDEASKDIDNRVVIFAKRRKWEPFIEKLWNKTIYRLSSRWENSIIDEFKYIFFIPFILRKNKILVDVFHIYNPFFLVSILNIFLRIAYRKSNIIFDIRTWPLKEGFKKILNYTLITLGHITASKTIVIHKNLLKNFFYTKKWSTYEVALWFEKSKKLPIQNDNPSLRKYIYIGSIYPRRDIDTLLGAFSKYLLSYPNDTLSLLWWWDIAYIEMLKNKYSTKNISFLWAVAQDSVQSYLTESNYGVAYIPMSSYFMDQPPLKTIEYLGIGIPVIGTKTHGNEVFITNTNGILCNDSIEEFAEWLLLFRRKFETYPPLHIIHSVESYEWKNIYTNLKNTIYSTMDD